MKKTITGAIMTLIIGGAAYTINTADVAKNFAKDTGMTQEQAEQYVGNISEDDIVPFEKVGADLIEEGQGLLDMLSDIDCVNNEYEWESESLTCNDAKTQLEKMGKDEVSLGQAYTKLGSESASKEDMLNTVRLIDQFNLDFESKVVGVILDRETIDETKLNNSYNKALLQTAIESE